MHFSKKIEDVCLEFKSDIDNGLSNEEANKRLRNNGKNLMPSKKRDSIFKLFLNEVSSPIEIILIVTIVLSFLIGEVVDAVVIIFIVLVDVIMGVYQEYKALKSAEALSEMLKDRSLVIRDGKEFEIDSESIVVGDILIVDSGTKIMADARIMECVNLQVDESVLTGESMAVRKSESLLGKSVVLAERKNMLYAGTSVMTGRAKAIVVGVGSDTEIGKIAMQVHNAVREKSPLTIRMEKFSRQISILILLVALLSAILLFMRGYEVKAIFLSVVALAVSAMPEGLTLALTMALTIASNRMSKKNVIVKELNSVEALGSCTVIASDKTGTLTVNEQTASKIVLADGSEFDITGTGYNTKGNVIAKDGVDIACASRLVRLCALNNEAKFSKSSDGYGYYGDSIDIAFLVLKEKMGLDVEYVIEEVIPYESEKQYSAVFYKQDGKLRCTVKGSLEKVIAFSKKKDLYIEKNEELSKNGYRVIAVCDGEVKGSNIKDIQNLEFLGLVGFIDPIRNDVKASIKECKNAGIKVVMITGDHPFTALSIARDLGLAKREEEVVMGSEIGSAYNKGEAYFDKFIATKRVFSRVTPSDKLHIVESFKRQGEFVAVTGDGVNDAPAIKAANIGIAMGSGTDVAKDTASMIIVDDNFKSIVAGIKEGRIAYSNIRKITLFLLSCGMAEVLFYLMSIGLGYELPLVAIQLLWINVVTDGLQDMALSFEGGSDEIMKDKPRDTKESLFSKDLMIEVVIFGFTIALLIFIVWKYLMDRNISLLVSRSMIMMLMVFIQNIHVLNCRSEKKSVFATRLFCNPFVIITIVGSIVLQLIVTEVRVFASILSITRLDYRVVLLLFILSFAIVVVGEVYKFIYRRIKMK